MPVVLFALLSGLVFGAGLAISDMVNPERVLNFFDVAGTWDPTLMFVMGGALAVTAAGYRLVFARGAPLTGGRFHLPTLTAIDAPLVLGAAVFGIGWGIAGLCPGPAIAALVSLQPKIWLFGAAMAAGMAGTKFWRTRRAAARATMTS